jgi:hypothetical protein
MKYVLWELLSWGWLLCCLAFIVKGIIALCDGNDYLIWAALLMGALALSSVAGIKSEKYKNE